MTPLPTYRLTVVSSSYVLSGDNFGVQVQEEVLSELHRSQEAALNLRDGIRTHYLSRGKLASKLLKYPHLEDYEV
jgi:proteasome activator subunit 3 (PA28 gamma)